MNILDTIEALCNESEENASATLAKIKSAIRNGKFPDFSKIKDGEHFMYRDIEFIRLGEEQGGILCVTAKSIYNIPFDKNGCDDWSKSALRKKLNSEFLAKLDENDLLPFEMDLVADNGDTAYGKCTDKVGILSCDLCRKYFKLIPHLSNWVWTCTPWYCGSECVRVVYSDGSQYYGFAFSSVGVAPACIIRNR